MNCPICNSEEDCDHLLAIIDRSFCCTSGGYAYHKEDQFRELIHENFFILLKKQAIQTFDNQYLFHLWKYASDNFKKESDELEIDQDVLYDLIGELFEECGAEESTNDNDAGMPGFSSVERFYYANDPKNVFETSLHSLKDLLKEKDTK